MMYVSTRDSNNKCSSAEAIRDGIAKDGGLFVPEYIPSLTKEDFDKIGEMSYEERAAFVLSKILEDYTYEELQGYSKNAYARFFGDPCPVVCVDEGLYVLELWHGPTCAFKDMALTMLPHLLTGARKKTGEKTKSLILVATSGDTGKAALEGFRDVEGTDIIVFYPSDGVSEMQKLQMKTQLGNNVYVCAIKGNFDDAQNAVKTIFNDPNIVKKLLEKGYKLSSANSINWGRLAPQIVYYISSYMDLVNSDQITFGEKVNFCVPSGNFGDILAGYYAYKMGVPVNKLICASNKNKVLTDFFETGTYDINRDFYKTISPSMDILISSNLERLLYEITGKDDKKLLLVCGIMPIITLLLLILMKSNVTIILYNLIYSVFTSIILLSRDIRLFNVTNSNNVNNEDRTEFLVIREFVLDMGRIVSYLTLLICGIFKSDLVLNITLVLLTLSIFVTSLYIRKISKFEYIKETK